MNIQKYKSKDMNVNAIKFYGWNWAECWDFVAGESLIHPSWIKDYEYIDISTQDGSKQVTRGDFIAKDNSGKIYVFSSDLFNYMFEVDEE